MKSTRNDLKEAAAWLRSVSFSAVKPWNEFLSGFAAPPSDWQQVEKQVAVNVAYYAGNYLWVAIACQLLAAFSSPLLVLVLPLSAVASALVFRPPKEIREPLEQILQSDFQRAIACLLLCSCLLLVTGSLGTSLGWLVVAAGLAAIHALLKKVTSRSRFSKMAFNVRFFGNRAAEDLPDAGAATQQRFEAQVPGDAAEPPQPQAASMDLGGEAGEDVEDIDLEAGAPAAPTRRHPHTDVKRD